MDFIYNSTGEIIDIAAEADIAAGEAVKITDDFYGVAPRPVKAGRTGAVATKGVFTATASEAIAKGDVVYLAAGKVTTTPVKGTKIGIALDAAESGAVLRVLLNAGASEAAE